MKNKCLLVLTLVLASIVVTSCSAQNRPSADTFKQVLNQKLQALRPTGWTERNVLFQSVKAGGSSGGSYQFQVTALVRDYGPGYPANRYYGNTCVRRFDNAQFTLYRDAFGKWAIDGALTPPMDTQTCKNNPAAGVSSIPASSLSGSPAPEGDPSAGAKPADTGKIATGQYECWAFSSARPALNFKITSGSNYTGSDGSAGSYTFNPSDGSLTFKGGFLPGAVPAGYHWVYHVPGGRPTASLRNAGNSEVSFCQWVR